MCVQWSRPFILSPYSQVREGATNITYELVSNSFLGHPFSLSHLPSFLPFCRLSAAALRPGSWINCFLSLLDPTATVTSPTVVTDSPPATNLPPLYLFPAMFSNMEGGPPPVSHRSGRFGRGARNEEPSLLWPLVCGMSHPRMVAWLCLNWNFATWWRRSYSGKLLLTSCTHWSLDLFLGFFELIFSILMLRCDPEHVTAGEGSPPHWTIQNCSDNYLQGLKA